MARADCTICGGSGWKVVERTTAGAQALSSDKPGASIGDPKMVWAVPCDCTAGDRTDRLLARARVPERYRHCDFDNFETDNEIDGASREQTEAWNRSLAQGKLVVQRFAEEFSPVREMQTEQGLLLMGTCGAGKRILPSPRLRTSSCAATAGLFYDYRELLKQIQDSYNAESQTTEMSVLEPVLAADVFVLDDVGSSKPSLWALETVGHILNTRYNEKRVTLLTTNYLDTDPAAPPPPTAPALRECAHRRSKTRLPSASANAFARAFTKCAARSSSPRPITARRSATPARGRA